MNQPVMIGSLNTMKAALASLGLPCWRLIDHLVLSDISEEAIPC